VRVLPLGDTRERALFARFAEVSRATIKGTLAVGAVQGLIGGVAFAHGHYLGGRCQAVGIAPAIERQCRAVVPE